MYETNIDIIKKIKCLSKSFSKGLFLIMFIFEKL